MSAATRMLARKAPLRARAIGLVGGRTLVARSNWDIVEVRELDGRLIMRHEVALDGELLLHAMRFAANRYLVVELGGGVMAAGCRAWDFELESWGDALLDRWDDTSLVGVDDNRARVALSDSRGVDVLDLATGKTLTRLPALSPDEVAFHPTRDEVVAVAGEPGTIEGDDQASVAILAGARVEHRLVSPAGAHRVAWCDAAHLVLLDYSGSLRLLNEALVEERTLGHCEGVQALCVTGRWIVARAAVKTTLFDARGLESPRELSGLAHLEPTGELAWVTDEAAGRVRFPRG